MPDNNLRNLQHWKNIQQVNRNLDLINDEREQNRRDQRHARERIDQLARLGRLNAARDKVEAMSMALRNGGAGGDHGRGVLRERRPRSPPLAPPSSMLVNVGSDPLLDGRDLALASPTPIPVAEHGHGRGRAYARGGLGGGDWPRRNRSLERDHVYDRVQDGYRAGGAEDRLFPEYDGYSYFTAVGDRRRVTWARDAYESGGGGRGGLSDFVGGLGRRVFGGLGGGGNVRGCDTEEVYYVDQNYVSSPFCTRCSETRFVAQRDRVWNCDIPSCENYAGMGWEGLLQARYRFSDDWGLGPEAFQDIEEEESNIWTRRLRRLRYGF